ncbi:MAG: hypothetical protein KME21_21580 [Desmonostoc vinosum HA7617-LM4]|jgi:hypothetical protein|nr:hypothetical protein [Desmonostoc vinosum HA7617-LM4]
MLNISANTVTDQVITLPETRVNLVATVSEKFQLHQWQQVSGPYSVIFQAPEQAKTSAIFKNAGTYVLRFSVIEADKTITHNDVKVTVNPNPVVIDNQSSALDHLKAMPRPVFKTGHTLPPLTSCACGVSKEMAKELAEHWGYAIHVPARDQTYLAYGSDYGYSQDEFVQYLKANPGKFKLSSGFGPLYKYFNNFDGRHPELPILPAATWLRHASGAFIVENNRPVVSPAAPNETFEIIGDFIGKSLALLEQQTGQKIDVFINMGEYGLWMLSGAGNTYLKQESTVLDHFASLGYTDIEDYAQVYAYMSWNKARQEKILKDKLFSYLKNTKKPVYTWYQEGYGAERGRWSGWQEWTFLYEKFVVNGVPQVSDYSSVEAYYNFHNSGFFGIHSGSEIPNDILTNALNDIAGCLSLGQKYAYPWVSIGWEQYQDQPIAESDRFLGFLKMYYAIGALGTVSGYFVCDSSAYASTLWNTLVTNGAVGTTTPTLTWQMALASHAQALFSHLEEYLHDGNLLPGEGKSPYQAYTPILSAYEFPAEGETQEILANSGWKIPVKTARVVARKIKNQDRWLVVAWANTGSDRSIRVTIDPRLGMLTLNARKCGSVYEVSLANGKTQIKLVDADGMNPTADMFA